MHRADNSLKRLPMHTFGLDEGLFSLLFSFVRIVWMKKRQLIIGQYRRPEFALEFWKILAFLKVFISPFLLNSGFFFALGTTINAEFTFSFC